MNIMNVLNDVAGSTAASSAKDKVQSLSSGLPGGLAGGAVAGGLVAMLVGSKSARKTAGKAAKYGGAALLGGLAYKAYKGWQTNNNSGSQSQPQQSHPTLSGWQDQQRFAFEEEALAHSRGDSPQRLQLILLKAMIAAARADGHIDESERARIFRAVEQMQLDAHTKTQLLDLFLQPIEIADFVHELHTLEQKSEVYLASCLAIEVDQTSEYEHLSKLSKALALPAGLEQQLRAQAAHAQLEAA